MIHFRVLLDSSFSQRISPIFRNVSFDRVSVFDVEFFFFFFLVFGGKFRKAVLEFVRIFNFTNRSILLGVFRSNRNGTLFDDESLANARS